jgi:hypothetical protein
MEIYQKEMFSRIREGDIFHDIEYVEDTFFRGVGYLGVSFLIFPYVIVLSQDCDLESDIRAREKQNQPNKEAVLSTDSVVESILICPAYDKDLFMAGKHLEEMNLSVMQSWKPKDTKWGILTKNKDPRYHFLTGNAELAINDMVIDFKHFYTIPRLKLYQEYEKRFVGTINPLFRELLSQRFANYLSRVGLPEPD